MKQYRKLCSISQPPINRLGSETKEIGQDELADLIHKQFKVKVQSLTMADDKYSLLNRGKLESALKFDGTHFMTYKKEGNDCDDFAAVLRGRVLHWCYLSGVKKGKAFGEIRGDFKHVKEPHRMNIVVCDDKKVYLVEPQSNKWYSAKTCTQVRAIWI